MIRDKIKNIYLRLKFYGLGNKSILKNNSVVFIMDKDYHKIHPGLVDRFKAIIGVYYIAKMNNRDFYLCYNTPFRLEKYLLPTKVNWNIDRKKISHCIFDTRLLKYDAKAEVPVLNNSIKEYHCYSYLGFNILREQHHKKWEEEWHDLFWELFQISPYLKKKMEDCAPTTDYVAVHLRFVNALDNFESGYDNQLDDEEKTKLIDNCLKKLEEIRRQNNTKEIYVFSDSKRFIKIAEKNGYKALKGIDNVGHITFSNSDDTYDKTFIDFFSLSRAEEVYAIRGGALYNSVYPQYASIVGGAKFTVVSID